MDFPMTRVARTMLGPLMNSARLGDDAIIRKIAVEIFVDGLAELLDGRHVGQIVDGKPAADVDDFKRDARQGGLAADVAAVFQGLDVFELVFIL